MPIPFQLKLMAKGCLQYPSYYCTCLPCAQYADTMMERPSLHGLLVLPLLLCLGSLLLPNRRHPFLQRLLSEHLFDRQCRRDIGPDDEQHCLHKHREDKTAKAPYDVLHHTKTLSDSCRPQMITFLKHTFSRRQQNCQERAGFAACRTEFKLSCVFVTHVQGVFRQVGHPHVAGCEKGAHHYNDVQSNRQLCFICHNASFTFCCCLPLLFGTARTH